MAAKSRKSEEQFVEAVDLIELLTPPGYDGCYEIEISPDFVYDEAIELLADTEADLSSEARSFDQLQKALGNSATPAKKLSQSEPNLTPRLPTKTATTAGKTEAPSIAIESLPKSPSARLAPLAAIANDSLARITDEVSLCQKCDLYKTRNKTVPGVGPANAKLVFIGEAPGSEEDSSGLPFVGKAGQHLDKVLLAAGFKREDIFICNILKCRPPNDRDPLLPEMLCCTPFLQRQLRLVKPQIIACLGNVAVKFVIGPDAPGITRIHGQWFKSIFDIPAMAMYHPAYLLRSASREKGSPNWEMWQDIQTLKKRYDSLSDK